MALEDLQGCSCGYNGHVVSWHYRYLFECTNPEVVQTARAIKRKAKAFVLRLCDLIDNSMAGAVVDAGQLPVRTPHSTGSWSIYLFCQRPLQSVRTLCRQNPF